MAFLDHDTSKIISSPNMEEIIADLISSNQRFRVFLGYIIEILAKKGNFTPFYQITTPYFLKRENKPIPMKGKIFPRDDKIMLYSYDLPVWRSVHITSAVFDIYSIFAVTPGQSYSAYEKLVLPFDRQIWIFLTCTFLIAFLVIFIVNCMPKIVQNILYGVGVDSPTVNTIAIFFGIGQSRLPENNFGRIILVTFIWFCLIFRTGYQGVFFEMLTTDMRKEPIKTINQILEENYEVNILNSYVELEQVQEIFKNDSRLSIKLQIPSALEYFYATQIKNASANLAFFLPNHYHSSLSFQNKICGIILQEKVQKHPRGFATFQHAAIFPLLSKVADQIISSGIAQWNYVKNKDQVFIDRSVKQPKVLAVDDLSFGFVVWMVSIGISLIGFLFEFPVNYFFNKTRKLRGEIFAGIAIFLAIKSRVEIFV